VALGKRALSSRDGRGTLPAVIAYTIRASTTSRTVVATAMTANSSVPTSGRHHRCSRVRARRWYGLPAGAGTTRGDGGG
jgi:hypothetical protein